MEKVAHALGAGAVAREAQSTANLINIVNKKLESHAKLKRLMTEFEGRVKTVEEVTGFTKEAR